MQAHSFLSLSWAYNPGAMKKSPPPDDNYIAPARELLKIGGEVAKLKASVQVLKAGLATLMNPGQPAIALKQLESSEQVVLAADPKQPERQQTADAVDAVQAWKK